MAVLMRLNTPVHLFMQYILCVYISLIQYTVIVLEALVHEEVSS